MHRFFGGMLKIVAVSACALAAVSCGAADNDPGPGGVTVGEARALDEAAEMLDERKADPASAATGDQNTADQNTADQDTADQDIADQDIADKKSAGQPTAADPAQ